MRRIPDPLPGLAVLAALSLLSGLSAPASAVTIRFDGGEEGIDSGDTNFSFQGSSWSGGVVATLGDPPLYESGLFSYMVADPGTGMALVTFDEPVTDVELFFVHGSVSGIDPGTATAFDAQGVVVGELASESATLAADVRPLDASAPIAEIELTGGAVDDFSYTFAPEPSSTACAAAAAGAVGSLALARRRRAARALARRV